MIEYTALLISGLTRNLNNYCLSERLNIHLHRLDNNLNCICRLPVHCVGVGPFESLDRALYGCIVCNEMQHAVYADGGLVYQKRI